jgi:F-type H+-transporting ATPase subunit b
MHIDPWTIGLQAINFLVLVWLLQHFLYAPVTVMLRARRAETTRVIEAAETKGAEAEALRSALDARLGAIETERQEILDAARTVAVADSARLHETAQSEADAALAAARQRIEEERHVAESELLSTSKSLAIAIARQLLDGILTGVPLAPFIDAALAEIVRLPADRRAALLQPGEEIAVASSEPLPPTMEDQLAAQLPEILDRPVSLTCSVRPDLIAGIEFAFPRLVIRRCWADDLNQILKELDHGDGAHGMPRTLAG